MKLVLRFDEIVHQTEGAWLLKFDSEQVWLTKSQCDMDEDDWTIEVPTWLVEENGLECYER